MDHPYAEGDGLFGAICEFVWPWPWPLEGWKKGKLQALQGWLLDVGYRWLFLRLLIHSWRRPTTIWRFGSSSGVQSSVLHLSASRTRRFITGLWEGSWEWLNFWREVFVSGAILGLIFGGFWSGPWCHVIGGSRGLFFKRYSWKDTHCKSLRAISSREWSQEGGPVMQVRKTSGSDHAHICGDLGSVRFHVCLHLA